MTTEEFKTLYDKLVKVYPFEFGNEIKEKAIFSYIKDLDKRWWSALVYRIILSSNPKIDISDAARGERNARKQAELTQNIISAQEMLSGNISNEGLEKALAEVGARSLTDILRFKPTGG